MPGVASVGSAADGGGLAGVPLEQGRAQWDWGVLCSSAILFLFISWK